MQRKNNLLSILIVLGGTLFLLILFTYWEVNKHYEYNQEIAQREMFSLLANPKWKVEKTYFLTQSHGSSTQLHVVKFECCGVGGMVKDGQIFMGYLNTVEATPIGTTTKQQIPELEIEILGHELLHYVTLQPYVLQQCPALANRELQEKIAYNWSHLYSQIRSLDEDNLLKLNK